MNSFKPDATSVLLATEVLPVNLGADTERSSPRKNTLAAVVHWSLREPMLQFVIAGALIFGVSHWVAELRDRSAKTIVVDAALQNRLAKLYALQLGAPPTDRQLAQLVDTYVHDEVLYREGLALGLDKGDEIIRRRLVQKMGFLQSDLIIAADPDDATLRSYFDQHREQFAAPASISFQQVFFGGEATAADAAYRRATQALARLNAADATSAAAGIDADRSPLEPQYRRQNRQELARLFGETPIVDQLLNAAPGRWVGPFQSGYGWHLVAVQERTEPSVPTFAVAREAVANTVRAQQKEENNRRSFQELLSRYDVQKTAAVVTP